NGKRLDEQSRSFGNLFPSISCATQLGKVQMQLVYTAKTLRPSYQQLSNNMSYGNRFLLQSGNPFLNHEYIHDLSLMGEWKFLNFSIGYNDRRDAIFYWAKQVEGNTAVTHLSQKNIPTLKSMSAQIAIAPNIGLWMPQFTASINKQWLLLHTDIADYKMNTPIFRLSFNNTFDFGKGWVASADSYISFKGYSENVYYSRNVGTIDLSLTKQLLKDQLSIRIQGNDIFHTDKWGTIFHAGLMQKKQISWSDSQEFVLTLRYNFNTTRSKYKGTGAGNDEKNRL
ncbi:MAG: outer membrane beta-barrel protein, partial [Bacteroidaceae bacterium]|nr:outer membrane beta-barrel protein [Bacteroidaceae bacterium]